MKYIPILKNKQGEIYALGNLSDAVAKSITPLIEIRSGKVNIDKLIDKWKGYFFAQLPFDADAVPIFFATNNKLIPVITPKYEDTPFWSDLLAISKAKNRFLFRLTPEDMDISEDFIVTPPHSLTNAINDTGINKERIAVLIDLGFINKSQLKVSELLSKLIISPLKKIGIKNIAISSSSMVNIADISLAGSEHLAVKLIPRLEAEIVKNIRNTFPDLIYSDYTCLGVYDHKFTDEEAKFMRGAAKIRYTLPNNHYLVIKGKQFIKRGKDQYPEMCSIIVNDDGFSGKDFSSSDKFIYDCSMKREPQKCGNLTTWITRDIVHHITLMIDEIA
jgi:hypothetical protein